MLKVFNTLTRTREVFGPLADNEVRMYSCGPTVYDRAHIGNFRSYVTWDLLRRALQADGYKVIHCMNITDVGHLVGDGDEGEDKLQQSANKIGKTAWEIAKDYEVKFVEDAKALGIVLPEAPLLCRATEHMDDQIKLIKILEEKGFTYRTSDGIYFDTSKFPEYGRLSGQLLEDKLAGARVEVNVEKKNPTDFALWKFSYPQGITREQYLEQSPGDIRARHMEWPSPWGLGFPGWHIECSAMSRKYLGQPFDIHCGGVDHISVHHENEIAQSVAAYGVPLAIYWMHNEFITVDGQKMSKSLGNFYTLEDCRARGIEPLALRYFYLGAHYRSKLNFTWQAVEAAQNALNGLREMAREWNTATQEESLDIYKKFLEEINDDLNSPAALAVMWDMAKSDLPSEAKSANLLAMDSVLGLGLSSHVAKPVNIPEEIKAVAMRRWEARARQDWAQSDQLRHELDQMGWRMEDGAEGYKLKPKI